MTDYVAQNLPLHARHVVDETVPERDEAGLPLRERSGFYQIGVEIEGVFVPIFESKADLVLTAVEAGKQQQQLEQQTSSG